jgi:hypothetical protein
VTVCHPHDVEVSQRLQTHDRLGEDHVRAEYPGLLAGPPGELVPADAVREAG